LTDEVRETLCSEHCICLRVPFSQKKAKQLSKDLEEIDRSVGKATSKLKIPATLRIRLQKHIVKKGWWRIVASLDSIEDEGINEKDFSKIFPHVQSVLEVLEKFNIEKYDGTTCTTFVFDSDQFCPVGELALPTRLTLRPDLVRRLGETELSGFFLNFKKSPLGLEAMKISVESKRLEIRPIIKSELTTTKDLVRNTFIHAKEVSLLFVEERK